MKIYERTSASRGLLNSDDSIKFESEIDEIADIAMYSPFFGLNIKGIISISSWNATRNIKYSGKGINDRDATVNDLDQYGRDANEAHFLRNTEFSKERTFKSPEDFSIWAKTSGIAELKFDHEMNNENTLAKNEMYNGKFNISMKNRHEFGWAGAYYITYNDWLGGICETPCWDQEYYNIILIDSRSFYTPISL